MCCRYIYYGGRKWSNLFCGLVVVVVLSSIIGCNSDREAQVLRSADSIMESSPDSVLLLLATLDSGNLKNRRNKAFYDLLLTQARVKTNVKINSDA